MVIYQTFFHSPISTSLRDDLALHLFNSRNLLILVNNSEFWAFDCRFLYTIVAIAIQSETLTAQARYEPIKIAYDFLNELNADSERLRSRKGKKSLHIDAKFAENISFKRMMNTLITFGYILKNLSDNF